MINYVLTFHTPIIIPDDENYLYYEFWDTSDGGQVDYLGIDGYDLKFQDGSILHIEKENVASEYRYTT